MTLSFLGVPSECCKIITACHCFLIIVFGPERVKLVSFSYHLRMECLSLKMNVDSFSISVQGVFLVAIT